MTNEVWVVVATYEETDRELDIKVFHTEASALAWRDKVANERWEVCLPDNVKPKENIGEKFFELMEEYGDAHFTYDWQEVLP